MERRKNKFLKESSNPSEIIGTFFVMEPLLELRL